MRQGQSAHPLNQPVPLNPTRQVRGDLTIPLYAAFYLRDLTVHGFTVAHGKGVHETNYRQWAIGQNCVPADLVIPLAIELGLIVDAPPTLDGLRARYAAAERALHGFVAVPPLAPGIMGIRQVQTYLGASMSQNAARLLELETALRDGHPDGALMLASMTGARYAEAKAYVDACSTWCVAIPSRHRSKYTRSNVSIRGWELDARMATMYAIDEFRAMHHLSPWCVEPKSHTAVAAGSVRVPEHVQMTVKAAAQKRRDVERIKGEMKLLNEQLDAVTAPLPLPTIDRPHVTLPAAPVKRGRSSVPSAEAASQPMTAPRKPGTAPAKGEIEVNVHGHRHVSAPVPEGFKVIRTADLMRLTNRSYKQLPFYVRTGVVERRFDAHAAYLVVPSEWLLSEAPPVVTTTKQKDGSELMTAKATAEALFTSHRKVLEMAAAGKITTVPTSRAVLYRVTPAMRKAAQVAKATADARMGREPKRWAAVDPSDTRPRNRYGHLHITEPIPEGFKAMRLDEFAACTGRTYGQLHYACGMGDVERRHDGHLSYLVTPASWVIQEPAPLPHEIPIPAGAEVLPLARVMALLGVTAETVNKMITTGQIRRVTVADGGTYLVTAAMREQAERKSAAVVGVQAPAVVPKFATAPPPPPRLEQMPRKAFVAPEPVRATLPTPVDVTLRGGAVSKVVRPDEVPASKAKAKAAVDDGPLDFDFMRGLLSSAESEPTTAGEV